MQFRQADRFPYCDNYLRYFFRHDVLKKQHPQVWDAFVEVGGDAQLATVALTYGQGPLLHIGCVPGGRQGKYWATGKTAFVHTLVAELYEFHRHPQQHMWDQAKQKHNLFDWMPWEATVLHELVHWARDFGRKPEDFEGEEAGFVFEKKAYARKITAGATKGQGKHDVCELDPRPPWM
jgi:hypothetical protein